jgi:hypothetical protein
MPDLETKLIPASEIKRLSEGSYEQLISRLEEAVAKDSKRIFGSVQETELISTFPGHAIVLGENGDFRQIRFESAQDGNLAITAIQEVAVPHFTKNNLNEFVEREASLVVDSFMRGGLTEAWSRLRGIIPYVEGDRKYSEEKLLSVMMESVRASRPWKTLFEEKQSEIKRVLWEDLAELDQNRLRAKFIKIYDGDLIEDNREGYKGLVESDLNYLSKRARALLCMIESAEQTVRPVLKSLKESGKDDILTTFGAFTEDLIDDLGRICDIVDSRCSNLHTISNLGKLYDTLAEELYIYEVAGLFIDKTARRLTEAFNSETKGSKS